MVRAQVPMRLAAIGALAASSCLIEPNPDFASTGDELGTSTGAGTESGAEPDTSAGSESGTSTGSATDTSTGSETGSACDHACEFGGDTFDCVDGVCVGLLEIPVTADTDAWSSAPTENHGTSATLYATDEQELGLRQTYIAIPTYDLPPEAVLLGFDLHVHGEAPGTVQLTSLQAAWTEDMLQWNNAPPYDQFGAVGTFVDVGDNTIELLTAIQDFGLMLDYGLIIRPGAPMNDVAMRSSEHPEGKGPRIQVRFQW
jgi:hypothetical protein